MKPILLAILDGMGISEKEEGNAFKKANTPVLDKLFLEYPNTKLNASEEFVGLPHGQMGNSEVGHLNIGAGRVVYQHLELINRSIESGLFQKNETFQKVFEHVNFNKSKLHILGLLSDGGVHSHINQIKELIKTARNSGVKEIYIHAFLDGRDVYYKSALKYINEISELEIGKIGTIMGRFYAMDRDKRWNRTKIAYDALVNGEGERTANVEETINKKYSEKINDEFIKPLILDERSNIEDNDGIIFANFRNDRPIQLSKAILNNNFNEFNCKKMKNIVFASLTKFSDELNTLIAFPPLNITNTLGEYISTCGKKQLRIAETEKYAHVTFFFNGGEDNEYPLEKRVLVSSPKVETYDLKPEMSAYEITDKLIEEIDNDYDLIVLNFANGDMVGHTGNFEAAVKAVEIVDDCLGKIYRKMEEVNGVMLVTADHGNCENMLEDNKIITSHTTNQVPFIITNKNKKLSEGSLSDIAPTILELMELKQPKEMNGKSLLKNV